MNETTKCIIERRSIRKYREEQITEEELNLVLLAGSYAPSAGGKQSSVMVVLQDKDIISNLGKINRQIFHLNRSPGIRTVSTEQPSIADDDRIVSAFYGAPTLVTVFVPKTDPYGIEDGSLVIGNMMIAAHSLGVASCFISRASETFDTDEARDIIKDWNISDEYVAIAHCILGYCEGNPPKAKLRKKYRVKRID
jgi:nitroreductase